MPKTIQIMATEEDGQETRCIFNCNTIDLIIIVGTAIVILNIHKNLGGTYPSVPNRICRNYISYETANYANLLAVVFVIDETVDLA